MEGLTIRSGMSPELVEVLESIRDAGSAGEPKYAADVCWELALTIAGRTYAFAVFELCHLVNVAHLCGGRKGYLGFFYSLDLSRASAFRGLVQEGLEDADPSAIDAPIIRVVGASVELQYSDGAFTIFFARMPFLAALIEFLFETMGQEVGNHLEGLLSGTCNRTRVSDTANSLSRAVYDYLKDNLMPAQRQRKTHVLIRYLRGRLGENFELTDIDDNMILDFWQKNANSESRLDFKTYESAFRTVIRLHHTLQAAPYLQELDNPLSIGADGKSGKVNPDTPKGQLEIDGTEWVHDETKLSTFPIKHRSYDHILTAVQDRKLLDKLGSPPKSKVKFLNKKERASLELLLDCGNLANLFPLSVLRCGVFGKGQARITEAARKKNAAKILPQAIVNSPIGDYTGLIHKYRLLSLHILKIKMATLHVLVKMRQIDPAVELLFELEPELDLSGLKERFNLKEWTAENGVTLNDEIIAEKFLSELEDGEHLGEETAILMMEARKAYKALSREGFRDQDFSDAEIQDGIVEGLPLITEIGRHLADFLKAVEKHTPKKGGWEDQFTADRDVFLSTFTEVYVREN